MKGDYFSSTLTGTEQDIIFIQKYKLPISQPGFYFPLSVPSGDASSVL